jgi:hypothetical protein
VVNLFSQGPGMEAFIGLFSLITEFVDVITYPNDPENKGSEVDEFQKPGIK